MKFFSKFENHDERDRCAVSAGEGGPLVTSLSAVTTSDAIYRRTGGDRWPVCLPPLGQMKILGKTCIDPVLPVWFNETKVFEI